MTTHAAVLVAALWSVTFGYEPSADSDVGYDYIVQVEPETLAAMERGDVPAIEATLPEEVNPVRRIRLVVGTEELPRKLRPPVGQAAAREARRPDIDAADAATLLAQTGPAGGFGRSATGFSNPPASAPPASNAGQTPAVTVPAPQYQPFSYRIPDNTQQGTAPEYNSTSTTEAAARPVAQPLEQAREAVREATNTVGQAGQQAVDNARQLVSDVIAPPRNDRYDAQANPLSNVAGRLQGEVRNTTDALRDSWDRTTGTTTQQQPAAAATQANPQQRTFDNWVGGTTSPPAMNNPSTSPNYRDDRYAQEPSILTGNQAQQPAGQPSAPLLEPPATGGNNTQPAGQDRSVVDLRNLGNWANQQQQNPATGSTTNSGNVAGDLNRGFEAGGATTGASGYPFTGSSWRDSTGTAANPASSGADSQTPWPAAHGGTANNASPPAVGIPANVAQQPPSPTQESGQPVLTQYNGGGNAQAHPPGGQPQASQGGGSAHPGLYIFAWALALGALGGNVYQWMSILNLQNKYRVALRRNSPGFGRSMAA